MVQDIRHTRVYIGRLKHHFMKPVVYQGCRHELKSGWGLILRGCHAGVGSAFEIEVLIIFIAQIAVILATANQPMGGESSVMYVSVKCINV